MQSWPGSGQNGANDGHSSWQAGFAYGGQNNQFDPGQAWSQPGSEQATAFSHIDPQEPAASNFFEAAHQGNAYLAGNLHGTASSQPTFHAGHNSLALNQQYSPPGQDVIDPAFSNIHPDLYGHQNKANIEADGLGHMGQVQNHPHAHSQAFSHHNFSFPPQNEQLYDSSVPYAQPQQLPQSARQDSHKPVQPQQQQQHFDALHSGFPQGQRFARPPQQSPVQHQQQPYSQGQTFTPPINGQQDQYQLNNPLAYQQPNQPYSPQPGYTSQKPHPYPQAAQSAPVQQSTPQPVQQRNTIPANHPTPVSSAGSNNTQYGTAQQPVDPTSGIASASATPPQVTEPPGKKRKRAVKTTPETSPPEQQPVQSIEAPVDLAAKKAEDTVPLIVPVPSQEEAQMIAQFFKRTKAQQIRYPSIKGLPHLVYDGSIQLPAPKSYDKLSPFVSLPSRSGRPMVPELGYCLPCEIQGKFTSQYRPSSEKGGLDERRDEAKQLLDDYDRAMKALGKRRPKYTEYPHAFKEQLKSDEASKNKAEKKAKKEMEDEKTKPIRGATRPDDPTEAAAWDAFAIVHIEPSVARTNALIAGRVQQAGEFFIKLRGEMNRAKLEADQATKDKLPEAEQIAAKKEAEQKKEAFYRAVDVTIEHADDAVLDNLGGHHKLVLSLVNAMISSIKAGDFSGKLPKALLELFTHFRMTRKIAETANLETVRKRFEDKGDNEVKGLAREIAVNMKRVTKPADSETTTGYTGTSAASRAKAGIKGPAEASSTKRSRDDESDSRSVKKIAVELGSGSLSKKLAQPKIQPPTISKTVAPKVMASSLLPGKNRPVPKPVPKQDTPTTDSSASSGDDKSKLEVKKSVPKIEATKPTVSKTESKPPPPKMGSAPSSSALSGIASLLDSINAPKAESVAPTSKETRGSETPEAPEDKAKRLRKEARRKLRVSWKPEGELVQIKIFHKDDEEDEGREVNMIRDAADDRSEGMVLKQRADVEEDDDDDDLPYTPWVGPVATDFSNLPDDVRNKSYVTRGGNVTFTTDEQQQIAQREQRELMAIYADDTDIPPTPKSPPPEMSVDIESKTGYLPQEGTNFEEIQLRWRDEQQVGLEEALRAAVRRLDAKNSPSSKLDSILGRLKGAGPESTASSQVTPSIQNHAIHHTVPLLVGATAEEQLLACLQADKTRSWRESQPTHGDAVRVYNYTDPKVRLMGSAIEDVVRVLLGKPFPPNNPPDWLQFDEERIREWWFGYNKEATARQKKEEEVRARAEAGANALKAAAALAAPSSGNPAQSNPQDWGAYYSQQQNYAPYMALLQQMTGGHHQPVQQLPAQAPPTQQPQIPDNQLQSILAAINQPQQPSQPPAANINNYLNPNDPSYQQLLMLTQMAQGQQPPAPPNHGGERDWDRNDNQGSRGDQYKDGKDGRKKKATLPPHKPANKALIGTKPCTFWQQGKCARGDKCTFRHG